MAEETKKQTNEEKAETSKEIVEDIKNSGVAEKVAEKEEKLDEKETKEADSKEHSEEKSESTGEKTEEKETKGSTKKTTKKSGKPKVKKSEAVVRGYGLPVSTKKSADMCRFIKGKSLQKAIAETEEIAAMRKPLPMRGELPHQKGIMSGGYPKKTAEHFVNLLRSLSANANYVGIENPVIAEAVANLAQRPFGKFGRVRRKRSHITIIAKEKSTLKKKKPSKKTTKKKVE